MLKKLIATTLCLVMLLSVIGVSAAVVEVKDPADDTTVIKTTYTDDFEHVETTGEKTVNGYTSGTAAYNSDVITASSTFKEGRGSIWADKGVGGSKAFKTRDLDSTTRRRLYTRSFDLGANGTKWYEFSFDFQTSSAAKGFYLASDLFYFNSTGVIRTYTSSAATARQDGGTYVANKWYKVTVVLHADEMQGWIYDHEGNFVAKSAYKYTSANGQIYIYNISSSYTSDPQLTLDNLKVVEYIPEKVAPAIVTAPAISGTMPANTEKVTVTVDQPLDLAKGVPTLTKAGDAAQNCGITMTTNGLYTYNITLPALESGASYTLDLSGLKNGAGAAIGSSATYSFTTAAAYVAPKVVSSVPEAGATNVSIGTKTMSIVFNKAMTAPQTTIVTGGTTDITATVTASNDNQTFTLNWTDNLEGLTTYTVSLANFKDDQETASETASLSFTTETTETVKLADSFENQSLINAGATGYNTASPSASVLKIPNATSVDDTAVEIRQVDGYTQGTKALQLTTGTTKTKSYLKQVETSEKHSVADNEVLIATWKFKLDKGAAYDSGSDLRGTRISVGGLRAEGASVPNFRNTITAIEGSNGSYKVGNRNENASARKPISANKWYNIVYVIKPTSEVIYFIDEATGEVIYTRSKTSSGGENYIVAMNAPALKDTNYYNVDQSFTIDDFTLWKIKPAQATQALTLASSVTSDFSGKNGIFTFNFSQPIMTDALSFKLFEEKAQGTAGALSNKAAYVVPTAKFVDFCKMEVTFPDLDPMADYTIDFSAATALSGAGFVAEKSDAFYEFTTPAISAPDGKIAVMGELETTGMKNGDVITATIYSDTTCSIDILTGFYKQAFPAQLKTVMITNGVQLNQGINTVEIPLTKDAPSDFVKIFAWEDMATMTPMMEDYKVLAPADALDILFIGSSLSEDSSRYFDKILAAAGEATDSTRRINVTTKFIGGSGFTHHPRNLKNEIESGMKEAFLTGNTAAMQAYVTEQEKIMDGDIETDEADSSRRLYNTFRNGKTDNDSIDDRLLLPAFLEKQYDFIVIQPSANTYKQEFITNGTEEESFPPFEEELAYYTSTIRALQPNAEIVMFQTWNLASKYSSVRRNFYTRLIQPYVNTWATDTGKNVDGITEENQPIVIAPAGYAFYLADTFLDWAGTFYSLGDGDATAAAKADTELSEKFNTSQGLHRDANHASYYGTYLADAVWYELFTGKMANPGTVANPAIPKPSGVGPVLDSSGNVIEGQTKTYFTLTDEEHFKRLTDLTDVAHKAVSEYTRFNRLNEQ